MSWFGFGGNKDKGSSAEGGSYDFAASSGGGGGGFNEDAASTFDNTASYGGGIAGGPSVGGGLGNLEEAVLAEQQKALIAQVIGRLTELSFDQCIGKPSSSLSSSEMTCVQATVSKYLDTSQFMLKRMERAQTQGR